MKRLTTFLLFLFIVIYAHGELRAQSGRTRTDQSRIGVGVNGTNSTSSGASDTDVYGEGVDDSQGEELEGDVIKVNTALVTIPVSVMDRSGKYAPDLRREDFHIFEEGVEQRIAYFATVDQPFTVAVMLDTSRSTNFRLEDIQDAAIAFVNQLKPADRVMVISFDDSIERASNFVLAGFSYQSTSS